MADSHEKARIGGGGRHNVLSPDDASPNLRNVIVRGDTGDFTESATNKKNIGPLGFVGTLVAGYVSFKTLPVGGTLTVHIVAYDKSANAEIVLTEVINPEVAVQTAREGDTFALATTNVELQADDTIEVHCIAGSGTVSTQQVDGAVALVFRPTADTFPVSY